MSTPTRFETICEHPKEMQRVRLIETCATCETTVVHCRQCGSDITEPKTDCI